METNGCPDTCRIVLRDQVAAAVTETGCAHPGPASWCCTGSDGARVLAPLVGIGRSAESFGLRNFVG